MQIPPSKETNLSKLRENDWMYIEFREEDRDMGVAIFVIILIVIMGSGALDNLFSVLVSALFVGGSFWLAVICAKGCVKQADKLSQKETDPKAWCDFWAAFGAAIGLGLFGTLWLITFGIIPASIHWPDWTDEFGFLGAVVVLFGIPILVGIAPVLLWKMYHEISRKVRVYLASRKEVSAYRKRVKDIKRISREINCENKEILKQIPRLKELQAMQLKDSDIVRTEHLVSLLNLAGEASDVSLNSCRNCVMIQRQLLEERKQLENNIYALASKFEEIGDVDKCEYYLNIIGSTKYLDKGKVLRDIETQKAESTRLVALERQNRRKSIVVLILIVTTLVTLEGYNYYYYNRAIQAYDGADYSRAIKEFGQIIGPFGEKNSLLKDAREKIGWIYYTSSGTLYVASEDGKYLQELDKNVSYTTAQDGKYLYYLKDDRNDTYDTAYVLNMESNKKEKLPINEGIFGYYRKNGTEIYAEGEHWERGRWYFNDRGDLIVSNFYRLDGNKAYQLRDDRDNYESISEIKKVQINSWTIEERSYEGKNGLLFSNQKTSEDTFVMGQYIAIAGVYQTGR